MRAALYEYAGAAFGFGDVVKLDMKLTASEQKIVEMEFAAITSMFDNISFLRAASKKFIEAIPNKKICERFSFSVDESSGFGLMLFLMADGDCISELAAAYAEFGFEERVMTHPGRWIFCFDGSSLSGSDRGGVAIYFLSIAKALGLNFYRIDVQKPAAAKSELLGILKKRGDKPHVMFIGDFSLSRLRDMLFFDDK